MLTAGFEDLLDQPVAHESTVPFICFTDIPDLKSDTWEIRPFSLMFPGDPSRSARLVKLCPHLFLPEFEESLYIDNRVRLRKPPEDVFDDLLRAQDDATFLLHPYRESVRDEFEAVRDGHSLEAPWVLDEQLAHYQAHRSESLELRPSKGGFMLRHHNRPRVVAAMELWMAHVLRFSRRDQLSGRVAFAEAGWSPRLLDIDIRDNPYCEWPAPATRDRSAGGLLPALSETAEDYELLERLATADQEIAALRIALADMAEDLRRTQTMVASMRSSKSWRYTKVLRQVRRSLPGSNPGT